MTAAPKFVYGCNAIFSCSVILLLQKIYRSEADTQAELIDYLLKFHWRISLQTDYIRKVTKYEQI